MKAWLGTLALGLLLAPSIALAACPELAPIGDKTVTEGELLTFTATATDADGDALTYSLINLVPAGAAIDPNTGVFTWTPTSDQGPGAFDVTIQVSDDAAEPCTDSEIIHVTVLDAAPENQCPVLDPIGDKTVTEGELLTFTATATDPDGDPLTYSLINLVPAGAAIDPNTGVFTWTPTSDQGPGASDVTIQVSDDAAEPCTDSEIIHVTVLDAAPENQPPVVDSPDTQTVDEGQTLTFDVTATDADEDVVALTASGVPSGAMFSDNENNSGTFTWMPGSEQSGTYTVLFMGDDGNGGVATDSTVITVNDVPEVDFETHAEIIGRYNTHKKFLCFRIRQGDAGFDLRDVDLSTLVLAFGGATLDPMAGKTHLAIDCDDCFDCDGDDDGEHDGEDDGDDDGEDDGDDDGDDCDEEDCEASHLRVCFSMSALRGFYEDDVLDGLKESEVQGTLTTGETFVASLGGKLLTPPPGHDRDDDGDDDRGKGDRGKKDLKLHVRPNPLNPKAEIRFTLAQSGPVRISLYDLNGRLVRTILNESRAAGEQVVSWDTSAGNTRIASGVYFLRIEARQGQDVRRVTVVK